jgi:tripartite-type tricarboxylate transporter receptor subunit TctC
MRIARRQLLKFAATGVAVPFISRFARAEAWPTRSIRVIAPISAGTGVDILSRLVLSEVASALGQPILIDNRPGAGGTIGAMAVAKANPDGYTLLSDSATHTIVPSMYSNLSYDPVRDFAPVVPLGSAPLVLVVPASKGIKTLNQLVSIAKSNPGSLTYASGGIGTTNHLAAERLRLSAKFEAVHVPFRGAGFTTELLSGRIDFAFSPIAPFVDLIQTSQVIALAVSSRKRASILPDVPTTLESGFKNSDFNFWVGMFAPMKTPREIVERLHYETRKVVSIPSVQEKIAKIGADPMLMTSQEFEDMIKDEFATNAALIKSIGLTPN